MRFPEFIEKYRDLDCGALDSLVVRKYVTMGEKIDAAQKIVGEMPAQPTAGEFVRKKEVLRFFTLLDAYTSIEIFDTEMTEENYDACQAIGAERLILENVPVYEFRKFERVIDDMLAVNDVLLLRQVLTVPDELSLSEERVKLNQELEDNTELIKQMFDIIYPHPQKE